MGDPRSCIWDEPWCGRCGLPADDSGLCVKHKEKVCVSCGAQATRGCSYTGQFVCGYPLCNDCTGTHGDSSKGLGWGFMGHKHVPKEERDDG